MIFIFYKWTEIYIKSYIVYDLCNIIDYYSLWFKIDK